MSAREVTDKLVPAIESGKYDAIVCNYANGDMVGHTGNLAAAVKAVETLDEAIGRVEAGARARGGGRGGDPRRPRQLRAHVRPRSRPAAPRPHPQSRSVRPRGAPRHDRRRWRAAGHRPDHAVANGIAAAARDDGETTGRSRTPLISRNL